MNNPSGEIPEGKVPEEEVLVKKSKFDLFFERNPHLINNYYAFLAMGTELELTEKELDKYKSNTKKKNHSDSSKKVTNGLED